MPEFVSAICALLLLILVSAFVVSKPFRDAVLGGPGSAKVLGIFTVQGVAIVLLCALFIGGLLYPVEYHQPEAVVLTETEKANLADLDRLLEQQKRSDLYRYVSDLRQSAEESHTERERAMKLTEELQKAQKSICQAHECVKTDGTCGSVRLEAGAIYGDQPANTPEGACCAFGDSVSHNRWRSSTKRIADRSRFFCSSPASLMDIT